MNNPDLPDITTDVLEIGPIRLIRREGQPWCLIVRSGSHWTYLTDDEVAIMRLWLQRDSTSANASTLGGEARCMLASQ